MYISDTLQQIEAPFGCCPQLLPHMVTPEDEFVAEFYLIIADTMDDLSEKAYAYGLYGDEEKARFYFNGINDFHYLLWTLVMIYDDDIVYYNANGSYMSQATIKATYYLECFRKYFQCMYNYNIDDVINLLLGTYIGEAGENIGGIGEGGVNPVEGGELNIEVSKPDPK